MADESVQEKLDSLTTAECRVLFWVCQGLPRAEIAQRLYVAENTVYFHLGNIYEKLGIENLARSQRQMLLIRDFCPLVVERVKDPDRDCTSGRGTGLEPEREPAEKTVAQVKEDEERGTIPISKAMIVPTPEHVHGEEGDDSNGGLRVQWTPDEDPARLVEEMGRRNRRLRRLLVLVGAAVFLLGAVAVLLAFSLVRPTEEEPTAASQTLAGPTSSSSSGDNQIVLTSQTPSALTVSDATAYPTYTPYPTPTERELPTYTPAPTYTPYPTLQAATAIVKVVTWTPTPKPTEPEVTADGSVLAVGEWWKVQGVWLKLSRFEPDDSGKINIDLEFWNKTGGTLLFSWSEAKNFSLVDNLGHRYEVHSQFRSEVTEAFKPSERRLLVWGLATMRYDDDSYFQPAVTDLYLTITELSRITEATWHIPLNK